MYYSPRKIILRSVIKSLKVIKFAFARHSLFLFTFFDVSVNNSLNKQMAYSSSLLASFTKTSLGLEPFAGPTIPRFSNKSITLAARLYPNLNLL